jgi:hypothetical protein
MCSSPSRHQAWLRPRPPKLRRGDSWGICGPRFSPVAILPTMTALPITSAGRFSPWGPLGMAVTAPDCCLAISRGQWLGRIAGCCAPGRPSWNPKCSIRHYLDGVSPFGHGARSKVKADLPYSAEYVRSRSIRRDRHNQTETLPERP